MFSIICVIIYAIMLFFFHRAFQARVEAYRNRFDINNRYYQNIRALDKALIGSLENKVALLESKISILEKKNSKFENKHSKLEEKNSKKNKKIKKIEWNKHEDSNI